MAAMSISHQVLLLPSGVRQKSRHDELVKFTTASRAEQVAVPLDVALAYVLFKVKAGNSENATNEICFYYIAQLRNALSLELYSRVNK